MMVTQVNMTIDPLELRRALGNFATGVTIMTANNGDYQVGVTANSFSSVSLEPPLILWSIEKRSKSFATFQSSSHFAVNILALDQIELSNKFARPSGDRFSGVNYTYGKGGSILFANTSASFECELYAIHDGGDHWIIIGKVVQFNDYGKSPLLYHQGAYSTVLPHPYLQSQPDSKQDQIQIRGILHGRLNNHPYYLLTQALRSYQEKYKPEQQKIGWRPDEARILMILDDNPNMAIDTLARAADMPQHLVEMTLNMLLSRGLIQSNDNLYKLTAKGTAWMADIWDLAQQQEEKIFSKFSTDEITIFKKILKDIINKD